MNPAQQSRQDPQFVEIVGRHYLITDLLQIATEGGEGPAMFSVELRSDAKESMNKTTLADHITFRQPTDLPLPDQMHRFVTIDRP
jgi:hypothetical protein